MCAVSHNCPLLGRNNETGDAPAAQARPWAPQFGPSVPPINNRHFITHACWRMGPRDSVCVAALFHCERARVTFCLERKAETVLQRKRPFASSCDCASGILRPSAGAAMHIQQPFTPLKRPSKAAVKCETWGGRAEGDALRHLADPLAAP